ncbi:MAG: cytochrome c [Hyphomicrobiales bacterium]|nr:cytochrome c [Hyphomicrobiales bacterium]
MFGRDQYFLQRTEFILGTIAAFALVFGVMFSVGNAAADEKTEAIEASRDWLGGIPAAPTEEWEVSFGGRLYDSWFSALDMDEPQETHPSYPPGGKKKGAATWRCKECHGWDYKGAVGAYAKGSHYTGIKGVNGQVGADPQTILSILRDETHKYSEEMIPEAAIQRLALFVTRGQHETDWYIDIASKRARGNAPRGERYFQNLCAPCHGFDGRAINFKAEGAPEYVGTVAAVNPWETLHKIRNGQPGQPMPVLRVLPLQDLVDILAYAQTLPAE